MVGTTRSQGIPSLDLHCLNRHRAEPANWAEPKNQGRDQSSEVDYAQNAAAYGRDHASPHPVDAKDHTACVESLKQEDRGVELVEDRPFGASLHTVSIAINLVSNFECLAIVLEWTVKTVLIVPIYIVCSLIYVHSPLLILISVAV
eukprot:CAMPEP_0170450706 /NCGR_PEP_ID=MMETSP0123-20130129/158_1 /TAXON_ID=182087 /ORGANISM="Favella ehrenbergii, Strain Fehren 1" /LENGTH=145 /DNA_ID=CAMNT_0010712087 /DNA_START=355 /DNA_END=792 /DNA_ORIENTATION=+